MSGPAMAKAKGTAASGGTKNKAPRLGAHMSIAGGFEKSVERGLRAGCETVQIFSKSNNQWAAAPIQPDDAKRFQAAVKDSGMGPFFSHTAYLINVGSPDREAWEKSREALRIEVERAETLGLAFVVLHPGSHKETGEPDCLKRIAEAVAWVADKTAGSRAGVLYEIAAGQGSAVGYSFEHLRDLLALTGRPARTGVCLDTCHLFAAGYDIRTKAAYEKTAAELDRIVGICNIRAVHLNDSKKELGCRVDRHEHIGQGAIGLEAFRCLMNDVRFRDIPMVLETPKDEETLAEDIENLKVLRGLIRNG